MKSGSWWWTGSPGVPWFIESDTTEWLNWKQTKLQTCRDRSSQNKNKNKNRVGMLRPAHSGLYLLCFQERNGKKKKKNSLFFFFLFTPTNSPLILFLPYQWRKGNNCHSCSCLAEDKTSDLLCLTITSCSAQGPIFLLFQIFLEKHEAQEIFTGVKGD